MKHIKSFKIFESLIQPNIEKICLLYEDVKSIGYILEEEGIYIDYKLIVVSTDNPYQQKQLVSVRINDCDDIRTWLSKPTCTLREFLINIENRESSVYTDFLDELGLDEPDSLKEPIMDESLFSDEVERYYTLLKEHLDYIPESVIKKQVVRSNGLIYEISIRSEFLPIDFFKS
jgi:hypothetical protein